MKPVEQLKHHPTVETLVDILSARTQNPDKSFFTILVCYHLTKLASMMRAKVDAQGFGNLHCNFYGINTAPSGYGKGHATKIMEEQVLHLFRNEFMEYTLPTIAEKSLTDLANKRALRKGVDEAEELDKVKQEYRRIGAYLTSFDSGTTPALKQFRHGLLMSEIGSINFECYTGDIEVLTEKGFQRFDQLNKTLKVAQYSEGLLTFVNPLRYIDKTYTGNIYHLVTPSGFDMSVTENHGVLVKTTNGSLTKVKPAEINTGHKIPVTGKSSYTFSQTLTDEMRLLIAIQADGNIQNSTVRLGFKKYRKIERLRNILEKLQFSYDVKHDSRGYTMFYIKLGQFTIKPSKSLADLITTLHVSVEFAEEFIQEVIQWDGSVRRNNLRYTNVDLKSVEVVQALGVLAGYRTKLYNNPKKGYGDCYYINLIKNVDFQSCAYLDKCSGNQPPIRKVEPFEGRVYCVTVPSGAIVLRRNGKTFIGGNCDEMANNLLSNKEILDTYLELYDGVVKPKLTKNTAESVRNEEIEGKTPTNMLMYGTASMLLDGSTTEKMFFDMLTTGYARRCFFGYSSIEACAKKLTVAERLANLTDTTSDTKLHNIAIQLHKLADPVNHNFQVRIPNGVMQSIIEYQIYCEELMESFRQSDEIRRAEARGRYFKTIRLAGAFAFLDSSTQMTIEHWEAAVKVAEMSAKCFNDLLSRDPAFARLALFLSEGKEPMTHADLMEEVPYFPKASNAQKDMIKHATAWGYKNNVIIKKTFTDDIEFLQGESLQATNLDQLMLSWSKDIAVGYTPELKVPFSKLDIIAKMDGGNWCNHRFLEGLRRQTHVIKGFNLLVLDIDGTATLDETKKILEDYTYYIYTTKRHQLTEDGKPAADRFRIILPMSHVLKLNIDEYKEFMHNVLETLPFETDEQTTQANRKWLANKDAQVFTNEGKLFDVLPFIPKTKKNEERKQFIDTTGSMDKLERYFFSKIEEGNRNNTIFKYGAALVDSGRGLDDLVLKIKSFNSKLPKPIPDEELNNTVIQSVTRQFYKKG